MELDEILERKKMALANMIVESREALIAELGKGRARIVLPSNVEIAVAHLAHPMTEAIIKSLHLNRKAMLAGPTGAGKTTIIEHIAEGLGVGFHKYSCSRDSSVHDLLGYKQPASETYLNTTFLDCYENGGVFLVDEYDAMSGDMALFFNGVSDNSNSISVPHRDEKPVAEKHKDFYIIMCGNTWGNGSIEYSGRDFQDKALMDRFRMCRFFIGYNEALEKTFVDDYQRVLRIRKNLEVVGSYLSTRNIQDIGILLNNGVEMRDTLVRLTSDLSEGEAAQILNL